MKTANQPLVAAALVLVFAESAHSQTPPVIDSFSRNGLLSFSDADYADYHYTVQWAPAPNGPWSLDWSALTDLQISQPDTSVAVPMFYRVAKAPRHGFDPQQVQGVYLAIALQSDGTPDNFEAEEWQLVLSGAGAASTTEIRMIEDPMYGGDTATPLQRTFAVNFLSDGTMTMTDQGASGESLTGTATADGNAILLTDDDTALIALRQSSGRSTGDMVGTYRGTGIDVSSPPEVSFGQLQYDGIGQYTIDPYTDFYYTYAVDFYGRIRWEGGGEVPTQLSADAEIGIGKNSYTAWTEIRSGTAGKLADFQGTYFVLSFIADASADSYQLDSITAQADGVGTVTLDSPGNPSFSYTVSTTGTLTFDAYEGQLSPSGRYFTAIGDPAQTGTNDTIIVGFRQP